MKATKTTAAPEMTPATPNTAGSTPSSGEIRLVDRGPRVHLPRWVTPRPDGRLLDVDQSGAVIESGDVLDDPAGDGLVGEPAVLKDLGALGVAEEALRDAL